MDWTETIAELVRLGCSQAQIAEAGGCSQGAVSLLARGVTKDPKHSSGERIREFLAKKRAEAAAAAAAKQCQSPAPPTSGAGGQVLATVAGGV